MELLPNLNGSVSDNTNFGRNIDPVTNQITIDRVRNNNFSLSSSVTLFNGFQSINTLGKITLIIYHRSTMPKNSQRYIGQYCNSLFAIAIQYGLS